MWGVIDALGGKCFVDNCSASVSSQVKSEKKKRRKNDK
jgi:hypothetical protein